MKNTNRETLRAKLKRQEIRLTAEHEERLRINRMLYDNQMDRHKENLSRYVKEARETVLEQFRKDAYVRELESRVEMLEGLVSYASRGSPVELPDTAGIGDMSINEARAAGLMPKE